MKKYLQNSKWIDCKHCGGGVPTKYTKKTWNNKVFKCSSCGVLHKFYK